MDSLRLKANFSYKIALSPYNLTQENTVERLIMSEKRLTQALQNILANGNSLAQGDASNVILSAHYETEESANPHIRGFFTLTSAFDLANLGQFSTKPYGDDIVSLSILARKNYFGSFLFFLMPSSEDFFTFTTNLISNKNTLPQNIHPADIEQIYTLYTQIIITYSERKPNWEAIVTSLLITLITCLSPDAHYIFTPGNTNETVALILNEITAHSESITLAKLSEKYSYTPTYLSELLRQKCGKTFSELVLEQRMERAKTLLIHTKLPVSTISSMIGYGGTTEFYRKFKDYFSLTPREMRSETF